MANIVSKALNSLAVLLPKGKSNPAGVSTTTTFNPSAANNVLSAPAYRDHLTDIFTTRASLSSQELIKSLLVNDPDMSATLNAFLTVADTKLLFRVKDPAGLTDPAGHVVLDNLLLNLTTRMDYATQGFKIVQSLNHLTEALRYMVLAQGAIGAELVLNKEAWPSEIRIADMNKIEWFEKKAAQFTPRQKTLNGDYIDLDIPTFFATWFRQDPTTIYSTSPFVSAINTIAARQQVINDLYRIMKVTGYPRMDISVMEEVLTKSAPQKVKIDPTALRQYVNGEINSIKNFVTNLSPEQAFIHTDAVTASMMNEKSAGMSLDITSIITTLNAQNQAGLRVMSTIIGRGESGVNTASVESRIFSMNADAINKPIGDLISQAFTLGLRLTGSLSSVEAWFSPVELNTESELEPQRTMKASRLRQDLSDGIITDEEYTLAMYNRLPNPTAPLLSGTGFATPTPAGDTSSAISNNDPLKRQSVPSGSKSANGNASKSGNTKRK